MLFTRKLVILYPFCIFQKKLHEKWFALKLIYVHLLCNRMNYVTLTVKKYRRHVFIVIYIYLNYIQVFFLQAISSSAFQFSRIHMHCANISKCVYVRCLFCS